MTHPWETIPINLGGQKRPASVYDEYSRGQKKFAAENTVPRWPELFDDKFERFEENNKFYYTYQNSVYMMCRPFWDQSDEAKKNVERELKIFGITQQNENALFFLTNCSLKEFNTKTDHHVIVYKDDAHKTSETYNIFKGQVQQPSDQQKDKVQNENIIHNNNVQHENITHNNNKSIRQCAWSNSGNIPLLFHKLQHLCDLQYSSI